MRRFVFILFIIGFFILDFYRITYSAPFISVDGYIWINNPNFYISDCRVFITDMENRSLFAIEPTKLGQLEAVLTDKMNLQKKLPKIHSHWSKIFLSVQVLNKKTKRAQRDEVNYDINLFSFSSCQIKHFVGKVISINKKIDVNDFHTWHFIGYYHW